MAKEAAEILDTLLEDLEGKDLNSILEEAERDPAFEKKLYLMGSFALEEAERNPTFREELYASLESCLTEEEDRALFDLPPKEKAKPAARKLH